MSDTPPTLADLDAEARLIYQEFALSASAIQGASAPYQAVGDLLLKIHAAAGGAVPPLLHRRTIYEETLQHHPFCPQADTWPPEATCPSCSAGWNQVLHTVDLMSDADGVWHAGP